MTIYFGKADDNTYDSALLYDVFRFRHKIFHDRLKWNVNSVHGMEYDEFDALNPYHMIATDKQGEVEACWRILPTTGPYMLKNIFPALLRGEPAPQHEKIWELSRFAVAPNDQKSSAQAVLNDLTFKMLRRGYEFAVEMNITHYITVTSVSLERILLYAGLPLRRMGDGQSQRIGKVTTVACWLDVNEQYYRTVYPCENTIQAA